MLLYSLSQFEFFVFIFVKSHKKTWHGQNAFIFLICNSFLFLCFFCNLQTVTQTTERKIFYAWKKMLLHCLKCCYNVNIDELPMIISFVGMDG